MDIPVRGGFYKSKAVKRKKLLEAAAEWNPTPALGVPPEEIAEPLTIMLWGVTTDKMKEWLKGVDTTAGTDVSEIKGVLRDFGDFAGEPSWT